MDGWTGLRVKKSSIILIFNPFEFLFLLHLGECRVEQVCAAVVKNNVKEILQSSDSLPLPFLLAATMFQCSLYYKDSWCKFMIILQLPQEGHKIYQLCQGVLQTQAEVGFNH